MLISKVLDEPGSGERAAAEPAGVVPEYQTASELFDLMTKNSHFDCTDDDSLTARDIVLLYKNIDIGTKLMNDATGLNLKKPNQYVETIIYNDERDSESDSSEIYSADDIHNVFKVNQERLDMFSGNSLENLLCHKLGGLEIQTAEITTEYDKKFLFKDPYIRNQLKNLNAMASSSEIDKLFPASLLDYICCKRLEDNYNFYMDNIIRYVQNTIEQLKRISNGDYLTDRAKEKWREVNSKHQENNATVLATSTSIPLHVECKRAGTVTWDDIVHSEMDVRSLSKILEKKIVVEIPKLISGSYRLRSKRCADNLIISCQREQQKIEKKSRESRVDVVLQLQRSQSGQVMSNISSIMILHTSSALPDIRRNQILPVPYHKATDEGCLSTQDLKNVTATVIETSNDSNVVHTELATKNAPAETVDQQTEEHEESQNGISIVESNDYPLSDRQPSCDTVSCSHSSEAIVAFKEFRENSVFPICSHETAYNIISPDELRMSMQRLNMQTSVLDESVEDLTSQSITKRKSPVRARIKSPYENKSFLLEEKKRKRLLEIRERREKKKLAMGENCKISKHKYGKSAILPQASSSVTKLSITNKSFYNSIYGQSHQLEIKTPRTRRSPRNNIPASDLTPVEQIKEEYFESPMLTPEKNCKKYTNRSYYLDDAETEMMHMQMKLNENNDMRITCSASNSVVSNEFNEKFYSLNHLIPPANTNFGNENDYRAAGKPEQSLAEVSCSGDESLLVLPLAECSVPANTATETQLTPKKNSSSNECRKSIDQLYNLIKQFGKPNATADISTAKSKVETNTDTSDGVGGSCSIQGSDSGTSVKHHITSSNHSGFSADKNNAIISKPNNNEAAVEPKVIISAKLHPPKVEVNKKKHDRRSSTVSPSLKSVPDNPLRAISKLLHEFDNVQKTKQKPVLGAKLLKRVEAVPNDVKSISRQPSYKKRSPHPERHLKDNDQERKVTPAYHNNPKDKRTRPMPPTEQPRVSHQQSHADGKHVDKITNKKIADIIDEAKEARGEAVRGPPKLNSRLHSLAQPKKCYVQAHHEEYNKRYGRNVLADRLQKLAGTGAPPTSNADRPVVVHSTFRNRVKKFGTEATSAASVKQTASLVPHLDSGAKGLSHRSASSSPNRQHAWHAPGVYKYGASEAPDAISKKMVAVASYLKSHYGRSSAPSSSRELLLSGLKSRAPFVPHDLELASMASSSVPEEAKELGNALHRMVNCMVGKPPSALSALAECVESTSKPSTSELSEDVQSSAAPRSESDYRLNVLEDKDLRTAVETIADTKKDEPDENICACPSTPASKSALVLKTFNSTTELQKLETALYSQISGAFQKRLRIKNLTLTPKQSMQQMFLVQSGDARPLLVKSNASNLKLNKCGTESLRELKVMPAPSNTHLDLTFAQIPLQIATVGYSFSEYEASRKAFNIEANLLEGPIESSKRAVNSASTPQANLLEIQLPENSVVNVQKAYPSDEIKQCFNEVLLNPPTEACTPIDVVKKFVTESSAIPVKNIIHQEINSQVPVETDKVEISNESHDYLDNINEKKICDNRDKASADEVSNHVIEEKTEKEIKAAGISSDPTSNVDYTTSLDMLVGILNEIQKITCQNQMVNDCVNCAGLETIHKSPKTVEKVGRNIAVDIISKSSLDNLRRLESDGSIYSFYISNNDISDNGEDRSKTTGIIEENAGTDPPNNNDVHKEAANKAIEVSKPPSFDKEVSANMSEYADTCTDVPSCLMPLAVNHSTNVTSSAIGVISEPSSILSFLNYKSTMIRSPSIKTIIQRPQIEMKHKRELISRDKSDLNKIFFKRSFSLIHSFEDVKNDKRLISRSELCCVKNIDFDPMLHIKRDILVTVYSILVLTVFAALSFPELIMYQY